MTAHLILSPKPQVVFEQRSEDNLRKDQKAELETRTPQKAERVERTKKVHTQIKLEAQSGMPPRSS